MKFVTLNWQAKGMQRVMRGRGGGGQVSVVKALRQTCVCSLCPPLELTDLVHVGVLTNVRDDARQDLQSQEYKLAETVPHTRGKKKRLL